MKRIAADWVVLGDKPPIRDGVVSVRDDGTIISISGGGEADQRTGVIMPGLVNAHTHLELSALRGRVPGRDGFISWVEKLIGARVELAEDEERDAIRAAVRELREAGTVAVGEVTNSLAAVTALAEAKISGCIFHEVFGQDLARLKERVSGLEAEL